MTIDPEKLAARIEVGSRFMGEDEKVVLAAAIETILLDEELMRLGLDEETVVLLGSKITDELLTRS